MQNIDDIKTRVIGPEEIVVQMVRSDYLSISNIFRVFFDIFLALTSVMVGVILSVTKVTVLHWLFLLVVAISMFSFLITSLVYKKKAREDGNTTSG